MSGIITDGDIRRILMKSDNQLGKLFLTPVKRLISKNPITVFPDTLCIDAVKLMEDNRKHRLVTVLPVIDSKGRPVGMIHIHDLIRMGFTFNRDSVGEK